MKCVLTGEATTTMFKGTPCSKEGRELLKETHSRYNSKIKKEFVDKALGRAKNNEEDLDEEKEDVLRKTFEKLAPKISANSMLKYIKIGVKDALETLQEVKDERES